MVSMILREKLSFDSNDSTPNTTYMINPVGSTSPNNIIEVYTNGQKRLAVSDGNLTHTPSGRPVMEFGATDGGGAAVQYRIRAPSATSKLLIFASTAEPYQLVEFAVQATDVLLEGRVVIKKRGSIARSGDLEFSESTPAIRCNGGLLVHLAANSGSPGNTKFEIAVQAAVAPSPPVPLVIVNPQADLIEFHKELRFYGNGATDRIISTSVGELTISGTTDVILRANDKSAVPTAKVRIKHYNTEVATFDQNAAVFNVKLDANAQGIQMKTVTGSNPTGGASGDLVIRTDTSRLFVNVSGVWKSVALA